MILGNLNEMRALVSTCWLQVVAVTTPTSCYHQRMDKHIARLNALLAGVGSAFALLPSNALERYMERESTSERIYANFQRVGCHLDAAMRQRKDEQEPNEKRSR